MCVGGWVSVCGWLDGVRVNVFVGAWVGRMGVCVWGGGAAIHIENQMSLA